MAKKIELRKIRDFGEVINDTFVFLAQNWKAFLKSYAVICGLFILASLLTTILSQLKTAQIMNYSGEYNNSPFRVFTLELVLSVIFKVLSYTTINLTTLSFIAIYREKGNETPTVEEVWNYFQFYFIRVVFSSVALFVGLFIAFCLCLIPGFYLWPAFSLVLPIMVFENTTLGYSFGRSFQLVKDNFWPTLGILVISSIVVYVCLLVVVLPMTVFNTASLLTGGHTMSTVYLILTAVAQHLCQVIYVMPTVAISICYFSLTEQKDNTGLLDRINSLGTPDEPTNQFPAEEY